MNRAAFLLGHTGHQNSFSLIALVSGLFICGIGFWLLDSQADSPRLKTSDVKESHPKRAFLFRPFSKKKVSLPKKLISWYRKPKYHRVCFTLLGLFLLLVGVALIVDGVS